MSKYEYIKTKKEHVYYYMTSKGKKYMYSFKYVADNGKRREKSKSGFDSEQEAYRAMLEMKIYVEDEDFAKLNPSKMTVGQWYDQWLEINKSSWAVNTYNNRFSFGRDYVKPMIGHIKLKDLTLTRYELLFIKQLETFEGDSSLSASTIDLYHTFMKICMNAAVKRKLISENQIVDATLPPIVHKRVKYVSAKELELILNDVYKNEPFSNFVLILCMAYTGSRIGELQALKWKHVNFEDNTILIEGTRKHHKISATKNKKIRKVKVSQNSMDYLKQYRIWSIKRLFKEQQQLSDDSYVFISEQKGTMISLGAITYCLKRVEKRTGIKISPHGFRHTHATILAAENKSFSTIAKRLGNTPEVVMHNYAHVTDEMETDLVDTFDDKISLSELLSEQIDNTATSVDNAGV